MDAQTGQATRYAASMQAYTQDQYLDSLKGHGFHDIVFYPSLAGVVDPAQSSLFAILARKD
jgi:hypothetical protein